MLNSAPVRLVGVLTHALSPSLDIRLQSSSWVSPRGGLSFGMDRQTSDLFSWTVASLNQLPVLSPPERGRPGFPLVTPPQWLGPHLLLTHIPCCCWPPGISKPHLCLLLPRTPYVLCHSTDPTSMPLIHFQALQGACPYGSSPSFPAFPQGTVSLSPLSPSCRHWADIRCPIPMCDKIFKILGGQRPMLSSRLFWITKQLNLGMERTLEIM